MKRLVILLIAFIHLLGPVSFTLLFLNENRVKYEKEITKEVDEEYTFQYRSEKKVTKSNFVEPIYYNRFWKKINLHPTIYSYKIFFREIVLYLFYCSIRI